MPSYGHLLPDREFPLLRMRAPTRVSGRTFFSPSHVVVGRDDHAGAGAAGASGCGRRAPPGDSSRRHRHCVACGGAIPGGAAALPTHLPDRSKGEGGKGVGGLRSELPQGKHQNPQGSS